MVVSDYVLILNLRLVYDKGYDNILLLRMIFFGFYVKLVILVVYGSILVQMLRDLRYFRIKWLVWELKFNRRMVYEKKRL